MTTAALDRARAALQQPPAAAVPGQLAVEDHRPIVAAGEPEALFTVDALRPPAPDSTLRCTWHPTGAFPAATHRLVLAVDLLDPRWWTDEHVPAHLYTVGCGVCGACIARGARSAAMGTVQHFVPLAAA